MARQKPFSPKRTTKTMWWKVLWCDDSSFFQGFALNSSTPKNSISKCTQCLKSSMMLGCVLCLTDQFWTHLWTVLKLYYAEKWGKAKIPLYKFTQLLNYLHVYTIKVFFLNILLKAFRFNLEVKERFTKKKQIIVFFKMIFLKKTFKN